MTTPLNYAEPCLGRLLHAPEFYYLLDLPQDPANKVQRDEWSRQVQAWTLEGESLVELAFGGCEG